jgi:LysM repeat protein
VPATYTVKIGDTISEIAARFGVSTASVLSVNGLGWKSLIFPGQVLTLGGSAVSAPPVETAVPTPGGPYTIVAGDTISGIAGRFGVSTQRVLDANKLSWSSIIYPGQVLTIPAATVVAAAAPVAAPVAAAPVAPAPVQAASVTYTIVGGDTVSSIASRFGVPIAAVLGANGLKLSSIIYVGRTLTIPTPGAVPASSPTQHGLSAEQVSVVQTVISVGRGLGVSDRGIVIALAAAAQESTLRNLSYGDRDSVGVFQQRPSTGWGSVAQLTTVEHSARLFYGGPSNPNAGRTRGLLDIPGWQNMSVAQAAQAVQISAFPSAYAKWESSAHAWLATFG